MERLEQEWEVCPVLHVDFSLTKYTELRDLTGQLNLFLSRWEEIYGKRKRKRGRQSVCKASSCVPTPRPESRL